MMRAFLIAAVLLLAAPAAAHAADASIWSRDLSLGTARAPAAVASAKRFDLVGVHWQGSGRVELRTRTSSGAWSPWQTAAPEAEDRPDRGAPGTHAARLDGRQPVVGPRLDAAGGAHGRPGDARASVVRAQPCRARPHPAGRLRGVAEDRSEKRLEGRREDRAVGTALRTRAALRRRPSHRRLERVPAGGVRGDRARDRALPRQGQRLGRHRLQLPRRPLRPGIRGPPRRVAAQRHRCARGRVQHRLGRHRGHRDVLGEGADA